jgi:hypothetical protein
MKRRGWQLACLLGLLLGAAPASVAQPIDAPRCGTGVHESEAFGFVKFPQDQIFCPLIADPKEPNSFASLLQGTFPSIEKPSGKGTTIASVGLADSFGLVRWGDQTPAKACSWTWSARFSRSSISTRRQTI